MTFLPIIFLPMLGYFAMAVLAVTPQAYAVRIALWPVVALCALHAALSADMSPGDPDWKSLNSLFVVWMSFIIARTFEWTVNKRSLVRSLYPANGPRSTLADGLDLVMSMRGHGWDWSKDVYIPHETRPTNRIGFVRYVALSAIFHGLICSLARAAIHAFSPVEFRTPTGGSIFDKTLPFHLRYPRACFITFLTTVVVYASVQVFYDAITLVGVLVFRQDPTQWPPAFEAPWYATSLGDFWGRRWHQFFRHVFSTFGGYPFSLVLGNSGLIIGTFLLSGVYHHFALVMLNDRAEPWRMTVGFGMMAPVIIAERAFQKFTGRKVGGVIGWLWTVFWLLIWGNVIVDGLARAALFGHFGFVGSTVPGQEIVERLVTDLDDWLHAM